MYVLEGLPTITANVTKSNEVITSSFTRDPGDDSDPDTGTTTITHAIPNEEFAAFIDNFRGTPSIHDELLTMVRYPGLGSPGVNPTTVPDGTITDFTFSIPVTAVQMIAAVNTSNLQIGYRDTNGILRRENPTLVAINPKANPTDTTQDVVLRLSFPPHANASNDSTDVIMIATGDSFTMEEDISLDAGTTVTIEHGLITIVFDNTNAVVQAADGRAIYITYSYQSIRATPGAEPTIYPADRCSWKFRANPEGGYTIDEGIFYDGTTAVLHIHTPRLGFIGKSGRFVEMAS